jgi:hypothetical protein
MVKERRSASRCIMLAVLVLGGCLNSTNVTMPIYFPPANKQMTVTAGHRSVLMVLHPDSKCMAKLPPNRTRLGAAESWRGQIEANIFATCLQENAKFSLHFRGRSGHSATGTWERNWSTRVWDLKKVQLGLCIVPDNGNLFNVRVVTARRC